MSLRGLTSALALCVGAEGFVILGDMCGREPDGYAVAIR